jgi:hypothetical protein
VLVALEQGDADEVFDGHDRFFEIARFPRCGRAALAFRGEPIDVVTSISVEEWQ